ncbi:MAG: RNA polymerase sigma-70 factor [Prevotella sp.]
MDIGSDILERLIEGDHKAFRVVFTTAYPKVFAFANGFVKNETDAEDIAQTVFIRLWTKRVALVGVKNLDSYLYVVTKNTVLNFIASQKAATIDITSIYNVGGDVASPLEQIEANDLKLLIDMVVSRMPQQRQTVYRLSREEGLTNDEIAQKMGLQKKTVENHLNLALKDIRNSMPTLIFLLLAWG